MNKEFKIKNYQKIDFVDITKLDKPEQHLIKCKEILRKSGARWFLGFGTALGFCRDKDFIPGDSDIDVVVFGDNFDYFKMINNFFKEYKQIRIIFDNERVYQCCFQTEDLLIIDICIYYQDGDEYFTKAEGGIYRDKAENIQPVMIKTKYGFFPFPIKIEDYLNDRYDDWRVPNHGNLTSSKKE